jgi:MFS family permease
MIGAPDIARTFELTHATTALVLFVVPGAIALVVEPALFLLADRYPRRWFIAGGLAVMSMAAVAAALAPSPVVLAIAFALWWIASGCACALAQATLVDRQPDQRARTMARWTMWSLAGDLLAPALLAGVAAAGLGWRTALAAIGGVLALWSLVVVLSPVEPSPRDVDDDAPAPSMWRALREALGDRVLVGWLLGVALCDLLDEILVVFASRHVRDELGAGVSWQGVIIGASMVGGAIGLVALERLLARYSETRLLVLTCVACVLSYAAWLAAPTPLWSAILMLPVGATSAPLYPLAAARAYARCPGRSGLVLAASHVFTPLGLALPWLLGLVADAAGTYVALALLAIQPLGLVLLVRMPRREHGSTAATTPAASAPPAERE